MKRFIMIILVLCQGSLWAQDLPVSLYRSMDTLSRAYQQAYPDSGMKAGLAILAIEENSELGRRNQLGKTLEVYLMQTVNRSIVYELVDRKNLGKLLEELEFSLSGLMDPDTVVDIGNLTGIKAFLWGGITETRDQFLVSLGVTDAATGKVLATSSFEIAQRTLVQTAEDLQYSYVAPNGIGITGHLFTPLYMVSDLYNKAPLILVDSGLAYRFSRNFMVSGGFMTAPVTTGEHFRQDGHFQATSIQPDLPANIPNHFGELMDSSSSSISQWTSQFRASFIRLDAQYTLNFNPKFNVGLAGGIFNSISNVRMYVDIGSDNSGLYYRKLLALETDPMSDPPVSGDYYYDMPFLDSDTVEYLFMDQFIPGIRAEIRPEFFITPRIALSARIGFLWMMPLRIREIHASQASWWFYQEGKDSSSWTPDPDYVPGTSSSGIDDFSEQQASWLYYGWNPLLRPDGKYWSYNISSAYLFLGVSFFF